MVNTKGLDPSKIKVDKKLYKNIFVYYICYATPNIVKPLYLTINKINGYIEQNK